MAVYWTFKFRSPLTPEGQSIASSVQERQVRTKGDDYTRAKDVAEWWLRTGPCAHPNSKFVFLGPACVCTEEQMIEAQVAEAKATVDAAKAAEKPAGTQRVGL